MYIYNIRHLWANNIPTELFSYSYNTVNIYRCMRRKKTFRSNIGSKLPVNYKRNLENVSFGKFPGRVKADEEVIFSYGKLIKPTIFTIAFCSASFAGATIWQYENMKKRAHFFTNKRHSIEWFKGKIGQIRQKQGDFRQYLNNWWTSLNDGHKIYYSILFANFLVLLAWKIPSLEPFMTRYFCSSPIAKAVCWPMFLSTFSHFSIPHFAANMFVLNSFIPGIVTNLGSEQFLAFYLSAGMIAALTSCVHRIASKQPSVSLGASGAIMGVIAYISTKNPDTLLQIIFLPFFAFKAGVAIKAIMLLDFTGLVLGWKLFDHAAHLGGAVFGIFWCHWGNEHIWKRRGPLLEWWHEKRTRGVKP